MKALISGIAEILFLPVLFVGGYLVVAVIGAATNTLPVR